MNQIKGLVKASLARDHFDVIFWSEPSIHTFNQAIISYQAMSSVYKRQIEQRALGKLKKPKEDKIHLAILHLLHLFMNSGCKINPENFNPKPEIQITLNDKARLAQSSFVKFYMQYLQAEAKKPIFYLSFSEVSMENKIQYCLRAIELIMSILKYDFIFLSFTQNCKQICELICQKIILNLGFNLSILKQFVEQNWQLILKSDQKSLQINEIYEKTIYFSKLSQKFDAIRIKTKSKVAFVFYKFNSEANQQIEKHMLNRDQQRREYNNSKLSKLSKMAAKQSHNPEDIDEDDIFLMDY